MKNISFVLIALFVAIISCNPTSKKTDDEVQLGVNADNFDTIIDGKQIQLFTLKNANGVQVQITNYGGRIVSVLTPDKVGNMADVVLGYNSIDAYLNDGMYMSGIIGRFGNRIKEGKFSIDGEEYTLAINNAPNALHGGLVGFDRKIWDAKQIDNQLELQYTSPDMEEGYPGELMVKVVYELTDSNELSMIYEAVTTKSTLVNLTNHTHYNLKGDTDTTILDHKLQLFASAYTPVDSNLIPTGVIAPVENTPLDFRAGKLIGNGINDTALQVILGFGFDHNWVVDKNEGELTLAAKLSEATTGRVMELYTTEPGIQFYTGNFTNGTVTGKSGNKYKYRCAVALEPQHYPDSPNQPNFPTTVLNPGEKYYQKSVLKFYTE